MRERHWSGREPRCSKSERNPSIMAALHGVVVTLLVQSLLEVPDHLGSFLKRSTSLEK